MQPMNPGSRAHTPKLDPKSSTYHDDLHKAKFITDKHLAAIKSGNAANIARADAEALDEAIARSLQITEKSPAPAQDKSVNTEKDNQALIDYKNPLTPKQSEVSGAQFNGEQRKRDEALIKKYKGEGYQFIKSSNNDHNCLIVSILQHLTGDYREASIKKHLEDASKYRQWLNAQLTRNLSSEQKSNFYKFTMLHADDLNLLLPEMKKEPRFKDKDLTVEIWTAGKNGEKVSYDVGAGSERFLIFQKTDHFVAVIPPQQATSSSTATVQTTKKN
jgi:hypothetical protein